LAIEYVVKDQAGAGLELDPGIYFQNRITSDAFDIPWKIFVSFPLKKDKISASSVLGGRSDQDPIYAPARLDHGFSPTACGLRCFPRAGPGLQSQ